MSVELPPLPKGVQIEYGSPAWMEHEYPSPMFSTDQMRAYARAAVDAALEAAAVKMEARAANIEKSNTYRGKVNSAGSFAAGIVEECAAAIRAMRSGVEHI